MATTISIPTAASLGAVAPEVATNLADDRGDFDARVANALIDVATAASTDITALQAGTTIADATAAVKGLVMLAGDLGGTGTAAATPRVGKINSASVPAAGALTTGNTLQVSGASALSYSALNLAGGANYVSGVLPSTNLFPATAIAAGAVTLIAQTGTTRTARGVVYTNQADLGAFVVASDDGITYAEGDRVLLTLQTTTTQNGLYVVGVVAGTAPLTRAADMPAAAVMPNGIVVEISEGTHYAGSSWKAMSTQAGGWTVGTHDPTFYPRVFKQTVTLAAGTYTIGFGSSATPDEPLFLFSTTKSTVHVTRDTAGGTLTGTVMYACPVTTRVAGKAGTAVLVINSVVEAGTLQNQDTSTLSVTATNW